MTMESYPKLDDCNIIKDLVEKYLLFIESLINVRQSKIDNEILNEILNLFYSVKTDKQTINELKKWIKEIEGLSEE